jgi:hypothetical protein
VSPFVPALAVAVVLLAFGLSACGGSSSTTGSGAATVATTTAATTAVAVKAREAATVVIRKFGSEASSAQAQQAEAVLHAYLGARAVSEWGRACSYLTVAKRDELGRIAEASVQAKGEGCAGVLAVLAKEVPSSERADLGKAEVVALRVGKGRSYAIYMAAGAEYATPMRFEGGSWRVVGAEPRPLMTVAKISTRTNYSQKES